MAASGKRRQAKKAARAKTETKRTKTIAADTGPVTLAEAKALAHAKQPKLAPRAVRKGAAPPASPATVGAERENLEKEWRDELARRVREYKATMAIMKKRGARRPRPKGAAKPKGEEPAPKGQIIHAAADFREDAPRHRLVEHLGERELGLQDGELVAITGGGRVPETDAAGVAAICAAIDRSCPPTARRTTAASAWGWHKT